MRRGFRLSPGFRQKLERSPTIQTMKRREANKVRRTAQALAPRGTEHYAKSLSVQEDGDQVAVVSTDIAAHLIEFGSVNNPVYAPLRRAAEAQGLRLKDTGGQ